VRGSAGELHMLQGACVNSLQKAVSFTGILPQVLLFPTLIRLLFQCIRIIHN